MAREKYLGRRPGARRRRLVDLVPTPFGLFMAALGLASLAIAGLSIWAAVSLVGDLHHFLTRACT